MDASNGSAQTQTPSSAVDILRRKLSEPGIVVCPGVYDGISARMALKAGASALYMTGAGTSASRLGLADLGFLSMNDMVANAGMITSIAGFSVPLVADADTGFGGPAQIARTVREYERAGVAALHIEDQIQTKRCGHLNSKILVPISDFVGRMRAASAARSPNSPIVLIARTDALAVSGFDDAIARLKAAKEAGADVAFLEGLTTEEEAVRAVRELAPMPLLVNLVQGGKTPLWSVQDAQRIGFKIAIFPTAGIFPAAAHLHRSYANLINTGLGLDSDVSAGDPASKITLRDFFGYHGLDEAMKIDETAMGMAGAYKGV